MLVYPQFDPVAVEIGPVAIHWYGLMYLVGFALGWWLGRVRAARADSRWRVEEVGDLLFFVALGVIVGGRVGYILFYHLDAFLGDPLMLLRVWEGGMSFHGGLIGVIVAAGLYARRRRKPFMAVTDFLAPLTPIGLAAGRIGNFINGELWGRVTNLPWGMVFPHVGPQPRHPSQLYEALLEGVVLFVVLWLFTRRARPLAAPSGLFLVAYGVLRFGVEFVRAPDPHLGFVAFGWMTMGQALRLPMVAAGLAMLAWAYRHPRVGDTG